MLPVRKCCSFSVTAVRNSTTFALTCAALHTASLYPASCLLCRRSLEAAVAAAAEVLNRSEWPAAIGGPLLKPYHSVLRYFQRLVPICSRVASFT